MNPDFMQNSPELMSQLQAAVEMFLFLMAEITVLFLVISALVGAINQKLPADKVQALLGGKRGKGYFLAAALGGITPFCSCSTIPMLIGLLKARAGFGPTMTFLITSPLLNPIVIALFIPVFGLQITLVYALIALSVALTAGVLLQYLGFERYVRTELLERKGKTCGEKAKTDARISQTPEKTACCSSNKKPAEESGCCSGDKPVKVESSCCGAADEPAKVESSCCGDTIKPAKVESACCQPNEAAAVTACCSSSEDPANPGTKQKTGINWQQAWQESTAMYREMLPYMVVAMILGALVHGFVPSDFFAEVAGADNPLAIPSAAVIGIPLYIRVTALLPLVGTLVSKGVSLGAVMALTIGAGGASIPEMIMLKRMFHWQLLAAFILVILCMAIGGGVVFNLMV